MVTIYPTSLRAAERLSSSLRWLGPLIGSSIPRSSRQYISQIFTTSKSRIFVSIIINYTFSIFSGHHWSSLSLMWVRFQFKLKRRFHIPTSFRLFLMDLICCKVSQTAQIHWYVATVMMRKDRFDPDSNEPKLFTSKGFGRGFWVNIKGKAVVGTWYTIIMVPV